MATTRTAEPWTAAPFVPERRSLNAFVATVHPASILRGDPEEREATLAAFVADLKVVAGLLAGAR